MRCPNCNEELMENDHFCKRCGMPVQGTYTAGNQNSYGPAAGQPSYSPLNQWMNQTGSPFPAKTITKQAYWKIYDNKDAKSVVIAAVILTYIMAGLDIVIGIFSGFSLYWNWGYFIDGLVFLGLALGMHLAKSRVCAIIIAAYSFIGKIITLAGGLNSFSLSGWLIGIGFLVVQVIAVIKLFKFCEDWEMYRKQASRPYM